MTRWNPVPVHHLNMERGDNATTQQRAKQTKTLDMTFHFYHLKQNKTLPVPKFQLWFWCFNHENRVPINVALGIYVLRNWSRASGKEIIALLERKGPGSSETVIGQRGSQQGEVRSGKQAAHLWEKNSTPESSLQMRLCLLAFWTWAPNLLCRAWALDEAPKLN